MRIHLHSALGSVVIRVAHLQLQLQHGGSCSNLRSSWHAHLIAVSGFLTAACFFCAIYCCCSCCCPFYSMPLISFQIAALRLAGRSERVRRMERKKELRYTYAKNCSICGIKPPALPHCLALFVIAAVFPVFLAFCCPLSVSFFD